MGSYGLGDYPRFYFYPDDAGSALTTISIEEPVTVLDVQPVVAADSAAALGRQVYRTAYAHCFAVRIVIERFQDADGTRERKLRALMSHLERGDWVAFSHDHDRTWASRASTTPGNGDTSLVTVDNLFTAFSASAALAQSDHVIVQSPGTYAKWEKVAIDSVTAGAPPAVTLGLTAANAIILDHVADTLVRWEGFFPRLVLPPGGTTQGALVDEYRNTWTLDLTLWTQPDSEHLAIEPEA